MESLLVQQNVVEYVGGFSRPPFSLWGNGQVLLEGLYDSFSQFNVSLKDLRVEGTPEDPSSQTIKVYLGASGQYRFRFDRVEATMTNGTATELESFPIIIRKGSTWLRAAVPEFAFKSHLLSYSAHASLSAATSESVLQGLRTPHLPALGATRGSGVIFHADDVARGWRLQLTLDHSLLVENGLFLQLSIFAVQDDIDSPPLFSAAERILSDSLSALGMSLDRG